MQSFKLYIFIIVNINIKVKIYFFICLKLIFSFVNFNFLTNYIFKIYKYIIIIKSNNVVDDVKLLDMINSGCYVNVIYLLSINHDYTSFKFYKMRLLYHLI